MENSSFWTPLSLIYYKTPFLLPCTEGEFNNEFKLFQLFKSHHVTSSHLHDKSTTYPRVSAVVSSTLKFVHIILPTLKARCLFFRSALIKIDTSKTSYACAKSVTWKTVYGTNTN